MKLKPPKKKVKKILRKKWMMFCMRLLEQPNQLLKFWKNDELMWLQYISLCIIQQNDKKQIKQKLPLALLQKDLVLLKQE